MLVINPFKRLLCGLLVVSLFILGFLSSFAQNNKLNMFNPKYVSDIDLIEAMDQLDQNEKLFFETQNKILDTQPAIAAMFGDTELELLSDDEFDLLWFVVVTLYFAINIKYKVPVIDVEKLITAEELNWDMLGKDPSQPWRKRLDPFYVNYPQEDLLSFIEDSFESDEDLQITGPAREVLFVSAKSILDNWL